MVAMKNFVVFCILNLSLVSCVSVKLPDGKLTPAKDVQFQAPLSPYKEITVESSDKTWVSKNTGNTISFLSECGNANDLTLPQIETESLAAISNLETLKVEEFEFNGRAARQSLSQGLVDGVPVQLALLVFKKNGCNFSLSYGGTKKNFDSEIHYFESFKQGFKAF